MRGSQASGKGMHRQQHHGEHRPTVRRFPLCLLAHRLSSPDNIGSLFRLADALGLEKLYLSGSSPHPPHRRIHRVARATDRVVPWQRVQQPLPLIQQLQQQGYRIISLERTTASTDLEDFHLPAGDRVCLIAGAERHGVEQALLDASDQCVHIGMQGQNSSMNVAMACAIAAYHITRQMLKAV